MADRIMRGGRQGLLLYTHNRHLLCARFRKFSSQNPDDSKDGPQNKEGANTSDSPHYWLDINRGIFGPKDSRFPLPGDLGTWTNIVKDDQSTLATFIDTTGTKVIVDSSTKLSNELPSGLSNELPSGLSNNMTKLLFSILITKKILHKYEQQILDEKKSLKALKELVSKEIATLEGDVSLAEDKESFCIKLRDINNYDGNLELFIIHCSPFLKSQFQDLFPNRQLSEGLVTAIIFSFKTEHNMSAWSEDMESEREQCLEKAIEQGESICKAFENDGFWADFIDPCSGRPYRGAYTNATLFETDDRFRYLGIRIDDLGCCKAVNHAVYGHNVFSYVLFTNAPVNLKFFMSLVENDEGAEGK